MNRRCAAALKLRGRNTFRQGGAAILLILLIAMTVGLALLFGSTSSGGRFLRQQPSQDAMATAKAALIGYAASYPEQVNPSRVWGYLPCPDTDNDGTQDTNFAVCPSGSLNNVLGRFPHRELGLPNLRDASAECLWYAAAATHKLNNDSSLMNWDLRGTIRVEDPNGSVLVDPADGADPSGGAVAAVFAPGPPLPSQARSGGVGQCPGDSTNTVTGWIDRPAYAPIVNGTLVTRQGIPGSATNNDLIAWITARELWDTIGRRNDLYTKIDALLVRVRDCLNTQPSLPAPIGLVDSGPGDPKQHGNATLLALPVCGLSAFEQDLWDNWRNQFRYVRCKTAGVDCLTVNGMACEGALLHGGRHVDGRPRTPAEANSTSSFFEGINEISLTTSGSAFASSAMAFGPTNQSADTAYCLDSMASPPITFNDPVVTAVAASSNLANFDTTTRVLSLGADDVDSGDFPFSELFGCAWIDQSQPIGKGFRAYFEFEFADTGPGFTFAVADAAQNSTTVCGSGGRHLGYSGVPSGGPTRILPPKLAVEIDTQFLPTLNDRLDPTSEDEHLAIMFWGDRSNPSDDNVHGAAGTSGDPNNPPASSAFEEPRIGATGKTRSVRVELHEVTPYDASSGTATYRLKAWINLQEPFNPSTPPRFNDTTVDFSGSFADVTLIDETFTVTDLVTGVRALATLRFGFTGASGTREQLVQIRNFEARLIP